MVPGIYPDMVFMNLKTAGNIFQFLVYLIRKGIKTTVELHGQYLLGTFMYDKHGSYVLQV